MPGSYKAAAVVLCLISVVAVTVVVTLAIERRPPELVRMGTAVVHTPTTLRREPADTSPASGSLSAGQPVEIVQYLPSRTVDPWALIRPAQNSKLYGYAHLFNLDHVQTNNAEFDVWYATQRLGEAGPADLKERLDAINKMLQNSSLPASRETDQTYLTLASESLRLASASVENKEDEDARAAIGGAEGYLSRLYGDSQGTPETDDIRAGIQKIQIALGDIPDPEKAAPPPPPSIRDELSRILDQANSAFAGGKYAKAAELAQQISTKGQGKRDVAGVVNQAKALLKKAETAQEEYEKANIQKR